MKILSSIVCLLLISKVATAQIEVINLLTENLKNPTSIDNPAPRFSWQLSEKNGTLVFQRAYEIVVDSTDIMDDKVIPVWSSGKVQSDQSLYVPYKGGLLQSGHKYCWKVRVADSQGKWSAWSQPSFLGNGSFIIAGLAGKMDWPRLQGCG